MIFRALRKINCLQNLDMTGKSRFNSFLRNLDRSGPKFSEVVSKLYTKIQWRNCWRGHVTPPHSFVIQVFIAVAWQRETCLPQRCVATVAGRHSRRGRHRFPLLLRNCRVYRGAAWANPLKYVRIFFISYWIYKKKISVQNGILHVQCAIHNAVI
jgi:hypothetical protein